MSHRIAVIVTTYNAPEALECVLAGYLRQTNPPDELVVADDGSDGRTASVVSAFTVRAGFSVRHAWQENLSFRAAKVRNESVKLTTADYLIFTDGDCVPHPSFVADHLRLKQDKYFVQGKRMLVGKDASPEFVYPGVPGLLGLCLAGQLSGCHRVIRIPGVARRVSGVKGIKTCNFAVTRRDFCAVNGFNEDFVGWGREDTELAVRLIRYGVKRKDPLFSALVFHLWHLENSRQNLPENERLLAETLASSQYRCKKGLCDQTFEDN